MTQHDFTLLYDQYPNVISEMPEVFSSHQFILRLARQNQALYIKALFDYRDILHRGESAPFMMVHGILAQHLNDLPELITKIGDVSSVDIFGQSNRCSQWRKL